MIPDKSGDANLSHVEMAERGSQLRLLMRACAAAGPLAQQSLVLTRMLTWQQPCSSAHQCHLLTKWIHLAGAGVDIIFCVICVQKRQSAGKQSAKQAADESNKSGKAAGAVERIAARSAQQTPAADRDTDVTAGSHQRPSTPPLTDGALLGRTLRKVTEEEKVGYIHILAMAAFSLLSPRHLQKEYVGNSSHLQTDHCFNCYASFRLDTMSAYLQMVA